MRFSFRIVCFAAFLSLSPAAVVSRDALVASIPIRFERAQSLSAEPSYVASGSGWAVTLSRSSAQLTCVDRDLQQAARIKMRMLGAARQSSMEASDPLPGATNY